MDGLLRARAAMRTFVLRARAAPTDSQRLLAAVGGEAHTEILAHTLMNAIFVAQSHRAGVVVYLLLTGLRWSWLLGAWRGRSRVQQRLLAGGAAAVRRRAGPGGRTNHRKCCVP